MKTVLLASLMGAAMIAPAHAQTTSMTQAGVAGPYIGLGVTTSEHRMIPGTKYAAKLFGGFDFSQKWGMEGGYIGQATFEESFSNPGIAGGNYYFKGRSKTFYVAGKATMQVTDRFALISKLGLTHNRAEVETGPNSPDDFAYKENKTGLYSALGAKYLVTPQVALTLEVERRGRSSWAGHKTEAVSVNASYRF